MQKKFWVYPLIPFLFLGMLLLTFVARFTSNIPREDSWGNVDFFIHPFNYNWQNILAFHNEHRIVWQNLFTIPFEWWTSWNVYAETFLVSFWIIAAGALLFAFTQKQLKGQSLVVHILVQSIFACTLFSLHQWDNLLWSFQFSWGLLFFIFVAFSLCWNKFLEENWAKVGVYICVILSPGTSAHGLLIPFFVISSSILNFFYDATSWRKNLPLVLLSILAISLYMQGYHRPIEHPDPWLFLHQRRLTIDFILSFLGNGLFFEALNAIKIGLFFLLSFSLIFLYWLQKGKIIPAFFYFLRNYPLLFLGLGALFLFLVGRLGFGLIASRLSRYMTFHAAILLGTWQFLINEIILKIKSEKKKIWVLSLSCVIAMSSYLYNGQVGLRSGLDMYTRQQALIKCLKSLPSNEYLTKCSYKGLVPEFFLKSNAMEEMRKQKLSFFKD